MPLEEKELKLSWRATMCLGEQGLKLLGVGGSNHVPWKTNVFEIMFDHNFCI